MSISPTEVKRCFLLSDEVKDCAGLDQGRFRECLNEKKDIVAQMSESQLDQRIPADGLRSRVSDYNQRSWRHDTISIDETQVFVGAGELPRHLTLGSVRQVAANISTAMASIPPCRGKSAIPGIISIAPIIRSERLLSVIALPTNDPYPPHNSRIRWHLDDGCMRAIALAIIRNETLSAYVGERSPHPIRPLPRRDNMFLNPPS